MKNIHYGDIHTKFPTIVDVQKENIPYINDSVPKDKIGKYELCKDGDLLVADASEDYDDIGKTIELTNIQSYKIIGGLHTLLLRDKSKNVSKGFNGYLFQTEKLKHDIKIIANGISVLGISKKQLQKINIKVPSKQEQEKIASFLSAVDKKISLMETKIKCFSSYVQFSRKLIMDSSNVLIKIRLKDVCRVNKDKQLNKSNMNSDGKYYVLNGGKNPSGYINSYNVSANTISISEGGNSCGFVNFNTENFYCSGHCFYLELCSDVISTELLYFCLKLNERVLCVYV